MSGRRRGKNTELKGGSYCRRKSRKIKKEKERETTEKE